MIYLYRKPGSDATEQEVEVAHFNVHELFDDNTLENDICVVLLKQPLRYQIPQMDKRFSFVLDSANNHLCLLF